LNRHDCGVPVTLSVIVHACGENAIELCRTSPLLQTVPKYSAVIDSVIFWHVDILRPMLLLALPPLAAAAGVIIMRAPRCCP
jgi:hypothetical protein